MSDAEPKDMARILTEMEAEGDIRIERGVPYRVGERTVGIREPYVIPVGPIDPVRDALEGMVYQFAYWSDGIGGISCGGLSALEDAFVVLGWEDPMPVPSMCCDEPGCMKQGTMGTPVVGGYRRTCWDHRPTGPEVERCDFRSPSRMKRCLLARGHDDIHTVEA